GHRVSVFQRLSDLGHGRLLLTYGHINTDEILALGIYDCVDRYSRFASLAIADYQFALAPANRDHGVYRLQTGQHRLANGLPVHHAGRNPFERIELALGVDRPMRIQRPAQRIDHAAHELLAYRDRHDSPCSLDLVAFFDLMVVAEQDG